MAVIDTNGLIAELGQRLGPLVSLVNLPSTVAAALREMGYATASPFTVADGDLSPVVAADVNELIEISVYEAAERIYENLDPVQLKQFGVDEDVEKLRRSWRMRTDNLLKKVKDRYSYGLGSLSSGTIGMDYQARGDFPEGCER